MSGDVHTLDSGSADRMRENETVQSVFGGAVGLLIGQGLCILSTI